MTLRPAWQTFETLGLWVVTPCKGGHGSHVGEVRRPGVSRETTLEHLPVAVVQSFPGAPYHAPSPASMGEITHPGRWCW